MNEISNHQQAIELLQEFGLKEYEAGCFVALSRRPQGTAKDISETSEVPRTRVYDAIRVLEAKGLVEIQHSNPKQFRAVPIDEAIETLRTEYEERAEKLRQVLDGLEPEQPAGEIDVTHEVWALSSTPGIESRVQQLIDEAEEEIIIVVGDAEILTEKLIDHLADAVDRGVNVVVGAEDAAVLEGAEPRLPEVETFVSGIEWLGHSAFPNDDTEIGRLLLVDQSSILVSSFTRDGSGERYHEQAVFGRGFDNGLVAVVRRLVASGFLSTAEATVE
ncbi:TrmB family transcriptional regulator [Haloplanus aerogenes]|uniref:Transcriptional regulator TrmB n=1 Tax=Haloplanus aerogenes TaxID=660522 RepID=A0A3M0D9N4_9EURY|nr:helix-turn-helix domain-containing protein [Haloplanus aerogenes]AZH26409.1 TrmB family transcriptional regulator [Haloplanus aerogenes]RMB18127.1 transcriptional regulator TrmB [Haloplanus aerogenes]